MLKTFLLLIFSVSIAGSQPLREFILGATDVYRVKGEEMKQLRRNAALRSAADLPRAELRRIHDELHMNTIILDPGPIPDPELRAICEEAVRAGISRIILSDPLILEFSGAEIFQWQAESFLPIRPDHGCEAVFDPDAETEAYSVDVDPIHPVVAADGRRANTLRIRTERFTDPISNQFPVELRRGAPYHLTVRMRTTGSAPPDTPLMRIGLRCDQPAWHLDTIITSSGVSRTYRDATLLTFTLDAGDRGILHQRERSATGNNDSPGAPRRTVLTISLSPTRTGAPPIRHQVDIDYVAVSDNAGRALMSEEANDQGVWKEKRMRLEDRCRRYYSTLPGLYRFRVAEHISGDKHASANRYLSAFLKRNISSAGKKDSIGSFTWFNISPWNLVTEQDIARERRAMYETMVTTNFGVPGLYLYPFVHLRGWWGAGGEPGIPRDEQYCTPLPDSTGEYYEYIPPHRSSGNVAQEGGKYWRTYFFNFLHPMRAIASIARQSGQSWIFTPQLHIWRFGSGWPHYPSVYTHKEQREPTVREIRLTSMLALSHGARGIIYYPYGSLPDREYRGPWVLPNPNDPCDTSFNPGSIGLVNPDTEPRYIDSYGDPKWESVAAQNRKLFELGSNLLHAEWDTTWIFGNGLDTTGIFRRSMVGAVTGRKAIPQSGTGDRRSEIVDMGSEEDSGRYIPGMVESREQTLVAMGLFHRRDTSYVMPVNMRVDRRGARYLSFSLGNRLPEGYYRITNVLTRKEWWRAIRKARPESPGAGSEPVTELYLPGDSWLYTIIRIDPFDALPDVGR